MALIVTGVAGKLAAGYAPFWFRGNKAVIGVGMVPRRGGRLDLRSGRSGLRRFRRGAIRRRHHDGHRDDPGTPPVLKLLLGASVLTDLEVDREPIDELVSDA